MTYVQNSAGLVVALVEGDPRDAASPVRRARSQPLGQQRRLPEACRRRHQHERRLGSAIQAITQPEAGHEPDWRLGDVELRLEEQGRRHGLHPPQARRTAQPPAEPGRGLRA